MSFIQVAALFAGLLWFVWLTKELAVLTWRRAAIGDTVTSDEALGIALKPVWFAFDVCVTYPVSLLIDRLSKKKA